MVPINEVIARMDAAQHEAKRQGKTGWSSDNNVTWAVFAGQEAVKQSNISLEFCFRANQGSR